MNAGEARGPSRPTDDGPRAAIPSADALRPSDPAPADGGAGASVSAGDSNLTGEGFDEAQQAALVLIGQALIEQSLPGTAAIEVVVTQTVSGQDVNLDFQLQLIRESGLAMPSVAGDTLVTAVQRLVLLWREYGRDPWRVFTYRLLRGESGPRFTSEFDY